MKQWAESFYKSVKWHRLRNSVKARAFGLCEICGQPGTIAHHEVVLTENNINKPEISLNPDLLVFVCQDCHNRIHSGTGKTREPIFDIDGNLLSTQTLDYSQYIIAPPCNAGKPHAQKTGLLFSMI